MLQAGEWGERGGWVCTAGYWEASLILEGRARMMIRCLGFWGSRCDAMRWVVTREGGYVHIGVSLTPGRFVAVTCGPAGTLSRLPI